MSSPQIIQQADDLKASVADTSSGSNEAWVSRQALQDLYQKLLIMDLEFALDKKVEQDLWNHAFKNQITVLQNQAKDKQNPKRSEIQSSLNLFLETAGGFYLQLLQELCSAFKLDLPFRRKSSSFGVLKEYDSISAKIRIPKASSSMYICQHCLVHLGDIARYRQQIDQAQSYYRHAAHLVPYNGQPYNQLAILEAAKSNKLATVFYYARSIAVKHPFPVASTNLDKFYTKIIKDTLDYRGKLSMSETISTFLQFHAFIHLDSDVDKARKHGERLIVSLPTHVTSTSFSSYQLVQMAAVNMFAIYLAQRGSTATGDEGKESEDGQADADCGRAFSVVFDLTMSMMEQLVYNTPKQEQKAKDYHTLPALKVILDWLLSKETLIAQPACRNSGIWGNLSKLLNNLQFHGGQKDFNFDPNKYLSVPLPEDCDLQCFLPMLKAYTHLDFTKFTNELMSGETEVRLRCQRLVEHGRQIADDFSRLDLLTYTRLKSGRLQFSSNQGTVKILGNVESNLQTERKSVRQNVAMQAIMQQKDSLQMTHKDGSLDQNIRQGEGSHARKHSFEDHRRDTNVLAHNVPDGPAPTHLTRQSPYQQQPEQQQYQQYGQYQQGYQQYQSLPFQQQHTEVVCSIDDEAGLPKSQQGPAGAGREGASPGTHPTRSVNVQPQVAGHQPPFAHGPLDSQGSLRAIPHQQVMGGYRVANGGGSPRSSLDITGQGPAQKTFQAAPGSGLSPVSQPSLVPGGPFSGQVTSLTSHHAPASGGRHQFPQTPGYPPQGSYPGPSLQYAGGDYSGAAMDCLMGSSSYGASFPPGAEMTPAIGTTQNPLHNLLGSTNLPSAFSLSPALLASLPGAGPDLGQGRPLDAFLGDDVAYPAVPGITGYPRDGDSHHSLMPQREEFNKDEPELDTDARFSPPLAMGLSGLAIDDQMVMPDSPVSDTSRISSLFPLPTDAGLGPPANNTYSLFSKSPWTVQLSKPESNKSLSSSPFGSGEDSSSLRNTPDPLSDMADVQTLPSGFPMGYAFGSPDRGWSGQSTAKQTEESTKTNTLLSNSIQSLWSAGPSPLEKLLEQQKQQQRHCDPH